MTIFNTNRQQSKKFRLPKNNIKNPKISIKINGL